ncbi:hypothetical protein [Roseivirga seohaensis]|uniref:hypothetical protein n=1 Tax=Roseivirga seohaensis TaxID=1914963 RepID=UPI003BAA00A3
MNPTQIQVLGAEFSLGQTVYLKTDDEQKPRMISGMMIRPGSIQYAVNSGATESWHYDIEISVDRDILMITS